MRRHSATRRTATAGAALSVAAVTLLTGCWSSGSANAGRSPSPSATAPSPSVATASPTSATTPATGTATPRRAVAPPRAAKSPSPSASPTAAAGCRSLTVSPAVKSEVTVAYGRQSRPQLVHIRPRTGTFYYGSCDGTAYAAAMFVPTADATSAELVAGQDEGAAMKYFSRSGNGSWTLIAGDGLPRDPHGCAAISQIPARLATLWADCLAVP
ncbi:hypothetical protein ABZ471_36380 [Streptomyces sp. NPDC005728]|uniref:hypothetical protein n=1 Tax=Streptomyces sp. NPDC005728 TaxID=3157054 RepID=UPI0033F32E8C